MMISDPVQPALIISLTTNAKGRIELQIGQIVSAIVERRGKANTVLLRVANQQLEVNTRHQLKEKQPLILEVTEQMGTKSDSGYFRHSRRKADKMANREKIFMPSSEGRSTQPLFYFA